MLLLNIKQLQVLYVRHLAKAQLQVKYNHKDVLNRNPPCRQVKFLESLF